MTTWTHIANEVSATWTHISNEVSATWNFIWSALKWHNWEDETTDNWENWG